MVADALSHRYALINMLDVHLVGFETIKPSYEEDADFTTILADCKQGSSGEFTVQERFLFKGNWLYIPKGPIWELLI